MRILETFKRLRASGPLARPPLTELLIFLAFLGLSVLMTWPWALVIRDAVPDTGDPYLVAWITWWDYHQTFHDPLNLFHAPIFFPYRYTLAFSEHCYGLALPFFPLYALGARPLAVQGVATLVGFALSGYGAFRLARTLTGSTGAAWIAGIAFAFTPYRFSQLSHLPYLFAGWIPLTLEALVLFARRRSWRRAAWLGAAFTMNGLTCIHWFVLSLIPLTLSGAFLLTRYRLWRDRALWLRGAVSLVAASLVLAPFFIPYLHAAKLYGTVRGAEEIIFYSARVSNWLTATTQNYIWRGFGPRPEAGERALFPGMLPLLLALAAFLLAGRRDVGAEDTGRGTRRVTAALDALVVASLVVTALAFGYEGGIRLLGLEALRVTSAARPLAVAALALLARLCVAYAGALRFGRDQSLVETIRAGRSSEALGLGLIWAALGFFGSLGSNFFLHRMLFEYIFLFRSIRVPARWAMIAHLGLALLAALGARRLAQTRSLKKLRLSPAAVFTALCVLLLFEQRAAPLRLVRGEADPDAVTLHLKRTPMRGGIVHLPAGGVAGNYRYVLRQADHERPLVTAVSGFGTPILSEVETLSRERPVPDRFLDLLEEIPASYLVVHDSALSTAERPAVNHLLARGVAGGRLRFIRSFAGTGVEGNDGADLYAVTATEPDAPSEAPLPSRLTPRELGASVRDEPTLLVSEFDRWSFPLYRFYKAAYGRPPRFDELMSDAETTGRGIVLYGKGWERQLDEQLRDFADGWAERPEFRRVFAGVTDDQYVERLFANAGLTPDAARQAALGRALGAGEETRASLLLRIVSDDTFARQEANRAFILLNYFGYLRRNPNDAPDNGWEGYNFWLAELEKSGDRRRLSFAFASAGEHRDAPRDGR